MGLITQYTIFRRNWSFHFRIDLESDYRNAMLSFLIKMWKTGAVMITRLFLSAVFTLNFKRFMSPCLSITYRCIIITRRLFYPKLQG